MKIYTISDKYVDFLRQYDHKVVYNKNSARPYIGVVFEINGINFFAPLASPKPKHVKLKEGVDVVKINGGKQGVINLNNMIPVPPTEINLLDFSTQPSKYASLLKSQQIFFRKNAILIKNKGLSLYSSYAQNTLQQNVKCRCCDFPLLEKISTTYTAPCATPTVSNQEENEK